MPHYDPRTALIVVDLQNDFAHPDGSLPVHGADNVIRACNREILRARRAGSTIIYTQDWHPPHTPHFQTHGGPWPTHCVADTWGAQLHDHLLIADTHNTSTLRKGVHGEDGYSAFTVRDPQTDHPRPTTLEPLLRQHQINRVVIVGLATDYCVRETAADALQLGFQTTLIHDAMAPVDLSPQDGQQALQHLTAAGAHIEPPNPAQPAQPHHSPLFTDLYELTMAQRYYELDMTAEAVFELAPRRLPNGWNFLLTAGLERTREALANLHFTDHDLAYLATLPQFDLNFLDRLADLRFTGQLLAPPEGEIIFPPEPIAQIIAPLPEAQLVETLILNHLSYATLTATKAARAILAANGKPLIEFGGRRAHGPDAAIQAARSAWIAGFQATSSVAAASQYHIPLTGTMGHSFILAHHHETDAFQAFAERYPNTTLLIDTYHTPTGAQRAANLAATLPKHAIDAIRIDSGDLAAEATHARQILDRHNLQHIRIVASGGLDEHRIAQLIDNHAPIDIFACGTAIVTSADAPSLDTAYKLVAYDGRPVAKTSPGKHSLPTRKQVWRTQPPSGHWHDLIDTFNANPPPNARPLLERVPLDQNNPRDNLTAARQRAHQRLTTLPPPLRDLRNNHPPPVTISPALTRHP